MKVVAFGDWHANTRYATRALNHARGSKADLYLHTGDFGAWQDRPGFIRSVNKVLVKQGRELWFVDGNHEDYTLLEGLPEDGRGLRRLASNIFHVPRGTRKRLGGTETLFLGGAVSIDQHWRTEGVDWFPQEQISSSDLDRALSQGPADLLICHEAPVMTWEGVSGVPGDLNAESWMTRAMIKKVITACGVRTCVHGHHHRHYESQWDGCRVFGLNKDGSPFNENSLVMDL